MAAPQPRPEENRRLADLRGEIQVGLDELDRGQHRDGEEVMAELLADFDDLPDEPDAAE